MPVSREQPEVIVGSRTCAYVLYLSMVGERPVVSDSIEDVLVARHRAGEPIDVDHAAISHLLHDGFVPPPLTVYRDVFGISVDLQARVDGKGIAFDRDFPFENHKSPLNGQPDTGFLLSRLAQATGAACPLGRDTVLMLSSGLDSTSVAVAAKEAGRDDVLCVTYGESENDIEITVARDTCRRLGLRHEAHLFDPRDLRTRTDLIAYASTVPQPCADPALTACVSLVRRVRQRLLFLAAPPPAGPCQDLARPGSLADVPPTEIHGPHALPPRADPGDPLGVAAPQWRVAAT